MKNNDNYFGWRYYEHTAIPALPHIEPDLSLIETNKIWKIWNKKVLLSMYFTEWDCSYPTNYWCVIKDTPFDFTTLKKKRRYEINKGCQHFKIEKINPSEHIDEIVDCAMTVWSTYPQKYRPKQTQETLKKQIDKWKHADVFAAFDNETGLLQGYAVLWDNGSCVRFSSLKSNPKFEKKGINAALIFKILEYYNDRFDGNFYINDGQRNLRHETNFQTYLEKKFGFRKAYCQLNIIYRPIIGFAVKILYPFRAFWTNSENKLGNKIFGVLKLEEIRRGFKN